MRLNLNMIVTFFIFYLFILPCFLGDRHPQGEARPESERRQTGRFPCVCLNLAPTWGLNFGANFRISRAFFWIVYILIAAFLSTWFTAMNWVLQHFPSVLFFNLKLYFSFFLILGVWNPCVKFQVLKATTMTSVSILQDLKSCNSQVYYNMATCGTLHLPLYSTHSFLPPQTRVSEPFCFVAAPGIFFLEPAPASQHINYFYFLALLTKFLQ